MTKIIIPSILLFFLIVIYNLIRPEIASANDFKIKGIDVSHHNRIQDWEKISKSHNFCIIKATEGAYLVDSKYKSYWSNSKKSKIIRGSYHFFSPNISGKKQFLNFSKNVKLSKGDLPPILDVELRNVDMKEVNVWLKLVEKHYKVKPIIYSSYIFFKIYMEGKVDKYPLWIYLNENFNVVPSFKNYQCILWQHNQKGNVLGIDGYVDLNKFLGTSKDFDKILIN